MTPDGRDAAEVLARARQAWSPRAADQERVRRAIGAALTAGAAASVPTPPLRAARWGTRLLAAWTIAVAGGGVGYWAGHRAGLREASALPVVAPLAPAVAPGAPLAPASPPAATPPVSAATPIVNHPGGRPSHREAESARPVTASLAAEVRALRNAERALREGNPGLSLAFLEDLDRQVPHGQLTEEREAMATLARCARGDRPIGVDLGGDFIERHPGSVYRARVEQACAATDSQGAGDSPSRRSGP